MEATKRTRLGDGDTGVEKVEERMDTEVWSELQNYILLDIVYETLPLEDRLQLHVVCKAWNHIALQRLEPKPYFVTIAESYSRDFDGLYLNGLVKYAVSSRELSFTRPIYRERGYACMPPFEVERLIFYEADDEDDVDELDDVDEVDGFSFDEVDGFGLDEVDEDDVDEVDYDENV